MNGFPSFEPVRARVPLRSGDWTIWPDAPQDRGEWILGHPFELHPMRFDFVRVGCDGRRLAIQPHYLKSTWDTFFTDADGCVQAQALGGLFPITLGRQPQLIEGIRSVLAVLPDYVRPEHPDAADKIAWIAQLLFGTECRVCVLPVAARGERIPQPPARPSLRSRAAERVWRIKMGAPPTPPPPVAPPGAP